jgi:DNA end-binding protein Ku
MSMAARRASSGHRHDGHGAADQERAGPRAIWTGTLSFGLVAVPVNLFPAVRPAGASLRLLAPDGTPVQRRWVCSEEDKDVPWDELVRGFEVGKGYVVLTDEELESVAPRRSRDIDLRLFVPADELDPFLFERAYVLAPGGESVKPYRLIAEVMEREGKAGVATFVLRS